MVDCLLFISDAGVAPKARRRSPTIVGKRTGVMYVCGYVGGYVWYLKISRDPDDAEQWEWYQIEAEHMRRRLGTIKIL